MACTILMMDTVLLTFRTLEIKVQYKALLG